MCKGNGLIQRATADQLRFTGRDRPLAELRLAELSDRFRLAEDGEVRTLNDRGRGNLPFAACPSE
jgi:hypothetical protein